MSDTSDVSTQDRPARARLLGLEPHPEGGWYRRTWAAGHPVTVAEADGGTGTRPAATLIHFLLAPGEWSAWHVVAFDEVWLWHGPGRVALQLGGTGAVPVDDGTRVLGPDLEHGELAQAVVPAGVWQRTLPGPEEALVSCVVSPGFTFDDWALAPGAEVGA